MIKKFFKTLFNVRPKVGDKVTTFVGLNGIEVTGIVFQVVEGTERNLGGYCWIDIFGKSGKVSRTISASFSYCRFNYV